MNGNGNGNGHGHDHDDTDDATPAPVNPDDERTPSEGIRAKGARRSVNIDLAVHAATVSLERAVRDGLRLAECLRGIREAWSWKILDDLEAKGRQAGDAFHQFARDIAEAKRRL